jgi:predicted component of viral defense system (DUF524 family)
MYVGDACLTSVADDLFRVRFENQLGLTTLQPYASGRPLSTALHIEVISPKFSTPERHLDFFRTLLDDLFARAARLPFTVSAVTARRVAESIRPPTSLFVLHFLCQHAAALQTALLIVCAAPHRRLRDRSESVLLAQASEVDVDVLDRILRAPEEWVRGSGFPLADWLHGFAPGRVWQRQPEETFDTPENRFVLDFLRQLLAVVEMLPSQPWWPSVPQPRQNTLRRLQSFLRQAIHHQMFATVGALHQIPSASQVLLRREGYRELLVLWQMFHHARRPLFAALQQAIAVRDVAKLYEMWAFFALAEEIAPLLDASPVIEMKLSDESGLGFNAEARFGAAAKLIYNRTWSPVSERWFSYSVPFRPDFTWVQDGRAEVVFDAKFRLDRFVPEGIEDDGSVEATARRADLHKMHTYRDALGIRAAVCVYPGNVSIFYDQRGQRGPDLNLRDLLLSNRSGVGALAMNPVTIAAKVG